MLRYTVVTAILVTALLGVIQTFDTSSKEIIATKSSGKGLEQISSEPTDFPGGDPNAVQVDVTTAKKDSIGNYHIKGAIKNLVDTSLEFVKVTGLFYDNENQTVGVTSCCYTDPTSIEPGRTATFDSFVLGDDMSGTPASYRLSFDWR